MNLEPLDPEAFRLEPVGLLVDLLPAPSILVSRAGEVLVGNRRARSLLQQGSDELIGRHLSELVTESREQTAALLRGWARSTQPTPGKLHVPRPAGSVPCSCLGSRLPSRAAEDPVRVLLQLRPKEAAADRFLVLNEKIQRLTREVDRRLRVEDELRQHRNHLLELVAERTRELEQAQEDLIIKEKLSVLGQLTATVSHELRNPLGTIRAATFSIRDALGSDPPDRVLRSLRLVDRNVERCDRIVADLLDYARERPLQLESVDLDSWLDDLLDEQPWPATVTCHRQLEAKLMLECDPELLRRAFVNVLTNALQAVEGHPEGTGTVEVRTWREGTLAKITIEDGGKGIDEDVRDKIFEPLFSTKAFGVGLGLSIVMSTMRAHGGGVELESEPGRGARATLWLPVEQKH